MSGNIVEWLQLHLTFPLVVVKNKYGSKVGARRNNVLKPVSFLLLLINSSLCLLGKDTCNLFTALDLKGGYWQVNLKIPSKEKQSSHVPKEHSSLTGYRLGWETPLAVFQKLINIFFKGKGEFAMIYQDGILIFLETRDYLVCYTQDVRGRIRMHNVK